MRGGIAQLFRREKRRSADEVVAEKIIAHRGRPVEFQNGIAVVGKERCSVAAFFRDGLRWHWTKPGHRRWRYGNPTYPRGRVGVFVPARSEGRQSANCFGECAQEAGARRCRPHVPFRHVCPFEAPRPRAILRANMAESRRLEGGIWAGPSRVRAGSKEGLDQGS